MNDPHEILVPPQAFPDVAASASEDLSAELQNSCLGAPLKGLYTGYVRVWKEQMESVQGFRIYLGFSVSA